MASKNRKTAQQNTNLLGLGLLILGAAAFIGVGILAYQKFTASAVEPNQTESQISFAKKDATLPQEQNQMPIPKAIDMNGEWSAHYGTANALLVMIKNMYQITFTIDETGETRYYTRGFFTYDEKSGKLTLTPDARAGQPDPIPGTEHKIITLRPFDIYVIRDLKSENIYMVPPKEMIATSQIHPIFSYLLPQKDPVLKWQPLSSNKK